MNDITIAEEGRALTAGQVVNHVRLIQQVMGDIMKADVHYGVIPGTKKNSLWKPGAEVLCVTFRIAPSYKVEDLSTEDERRYRITCVGTHQVSGQTLGEGIGACSSMEEKYKWRKAVHRKEYEAADTLRRRTKYGYDGKETLQVRTEPADLDNTILKMACKRAQVAMSINVTGASDIFNQDLEDLPEEYVASEVAQETDKKFTQPSAKSDSAEPLKIDPATDSPAGEGPVRLIKKKLEDAALTDAELFKKFSIASFEEIKVSMLNGILKWISGPTS